jgi:hypothetical protein
MKALPLTFASIAILGLSACETPNPNISSTIQLPSSLVNEALSEPNQMLLNAMMGMMQTNGSSQTDVAINATVIQGSQMVMDNLQLTSMQRFNLELEAQLKTNDWLGSTPQASLIVDLVDLTSTQTETLGPSTNTTTFNLSDQRLEVYYEAETIYLNLSHATDISSLFPMLTLPEKTKYHVGTPEALGFVTEPMTETEVEAAIATLLPMLEMMPLVQTTIQGTNLVIRYELTPETLPSIISNIVLQGSDITTVTSEDLESINAMIALMLAQIDLTTFVIEVAINLLTSQLINLMVDIDVRIDTSVTDSEADYLINSYLDLDVTVGVQMLLFLENRPVALPVDKEEYVLVEDTTT